ncbi:sensor domain-containing diguanylate cyclase [Acinetobacter sp. ANC 4910]|uniref:sensor domain-containing diguanylate cyclase n=1 Tax=Acinetobacter sp. ANC 4910 TaxID=2529850 RepID=UPI00103B8BCA|nr:sensor domain-containing diguanylate cyclase [Acinetobacter sp. ANC 4910]TCB35362.1 sensor domain-containing diguanylate cyclase [Acinetobacter sp. ANC 4910]
MNNNTAERVYPPNQLKPLNESDCIQLPINFIHDLAQADCLRSLLDKIACWLSQVFQAERVSITLYDRPNFLKLYSISGNQAIPLDFKLPIQNTFVGRVFSTATLRICDDVTLFEELDCQMLAQNGMGSCMDVPLIHNGNCLGTLNVADHAKFHYTEQQAIFLQCLANWIALNIKLHLQVQEMQKLTSTDELTGTFNRRMFTQQSNHNMSLFSNANTPFSMGILDIDYFKTLNDFYGHQAGDYVLQQMCECIQTYLSEHDFLARIGGEEFAIILPTHSAKDAIKRFKQIRAAIEDLKIPYLEEIICFTVSIGVAEAHATDLSAETVLKRADKALSQAKQAGRNRVHLDMPIYKI